MVNITSGAVKAPIDVLGLEQRRAQRAHRFRRRAGAPIAPGFAQRHDQQPAARHLRHRPHSGHAEGPGRQDRKVDRELKAARRATVPAGRYGTLEEFGQICAFLCSAQASYLTGQNILLDGGAYPGTY